MDEPIKTIGSTSVTYEITSLRSWQLEWNSMKFSFGASIVLTYMNIDDVLTGTETLLEVKELKNQLILINIFPKGEMDLHKWCGNNDELSEISGNNYDFSDPSEIKALGAKIIIWGGYEKTPNVTLCPISPGYMIY
ncbi:hypothetical protein NPIL_44971 [Nephila pilipes]|uniref:Uncharacterized protein n=1 Tax=Nephila pilipes TaxID=299642 RepID=A0A8X6UI25_NEPPI|nr:hypothetical protein NPIL_44971 [Nephila pilipes]